MRLSYLVLCAAAAAPASAADLPLANFARHPQYEAVKISPDGEYLAAKAVVGGQRVLSLIHLSDMKGVNVTPRVNGHVIDFEWIGPHVMYTIGIPYGGLELPVSTGQVYSVNADGTDAKVALDGDQLPVALQKDDTSVVRIFHEAQGSKFRAEAVKEHLRHRNTDTLGKLPLDFPQLVLDHDDHVRFAYGTDLEQTEKVYYRENDAAQWERLFEAADEMAARPLMFNRAGDAVYFDCGGLCRWDVGSRKLSRIWPGNGAEIAALVPSFDGMDLVGVRTEPGRPALTLLDKNAAEAKLLAQLMQQFPGAHVQFTSNSRNGKRAVLLVDSGSDPGAFYLYDSEQRKVSFLLARRPWIKPEQMAQVQPFELEARDGMKLHGYLTRPPGKSDAKDLPMVVYVHGGPYNIRDNWMFDSDVQALASRGYAVLQVNFRGSGGYYDSYVRAGFREWGAKMQDDVTDATRWAIREGVANPDRICIFGASYGGYAALEGAVKEPDLYKCTIGYVGVYDLRLMYRRGDIPQTIYGEKYLKTVLGENQDELYDRSPIAHVDRIKAKVMLIVGGADPRVPPIQGENLHAALEQRKIPHEWVYERTEGHGFYDEKHVEQLYQKLLAFLDRNIGAAAVH